MARGWRQETGRHLRARSGSSSRRVYPAQPPALSLPFRLWVSGVICCVADPSTGLVRIAHDYDGTTSEMWAEAGMLPTPLPFPLDGHATFWTAPSGVRRPGHALTGIQEGLSAMLDTQAREVWGQGGASE